MSFLAGLVCTVRGTAQLAVTPSLWTYAWAPVLVAAAIGVGAVEFVRWLASEQIAAWAEAAVGGRGWTDWIVGALVWAASILVAFAIFAPLVRVVAAPFLSLLADRTVASLIGRPSPSGPGGRAMRWVLRPVLDALALFAIRLGITIVALPLFFVPVAGPFLFGGVSMLLLGVDLIDIAQSARGVLLGARLSFVSRHMGACLGLGVGAGLLLLVPCVNVLLLPAAVVGAVLLDRRLSPDFPGAAAA